MTAVRPPWVVSAVSTSGVSANEAREDLQLTSLRNRLEHRIQGLGAAIVAFSGGVDSSLVAALAARALAARALAVTAASPALASGELEGARRVARAVGIAHQVISTEELSNPRYRANDRFRCFHCKSELYSRLAALAADRGYEALLSGANADDAGDWRPGLQAAANHGVVHPLLEIGIGKPTVRALAAELDVPSASKPATPCLASRIPYGTPVDAATLARIDRAESGLRALGHRILRVRHYGRLGRVELGAEELEAARDPGVRDGIDAALRRAGYEWVEIDPHPFQSGSLNRAAKGSESG